MMPVPDSESSLHNLKAINFQEESVSQRARDSDSESAQWHLERTSQSCHCRSLSATVAPEPAAGLPLAVGEGISLAH